MNPGYVFLRLRSRQDLMVGVLIRWRRDPTTILEPCSQRVRVPLKCCPWMSSSLGQMVPLMVAFATHAHVRFERKDVASLLKCSKVSGGERAEIKSNQFNHLNQLQCACKRGVKLNIGPFCFMMNTKQRANLSFFFFFSTYRRGKWIEELFIIDWWHSQRRFGQEFIYFLFCCHWDCFSGHYLKKQN